MPSPIEVGGRILADQTSRTPLEGDGGTLTRHDATGTTEVRWRRNEHGDPVVSALP